MTGLKSGVILARRNEIVCHLDGVLPDQVHVVHHGGVFGLEEIVKYGAKAPIVVVSCLRFGDTDLNATNTKVGYGVFVVTSDKKLESHKDLDRHDQALLLGEAVFRIIMDPGFAPATGCSGPVDNLVADNQYGRALDNKGMALWAAAWAEETQLAEDVGDDLVDLDTLWTSIVPEEDLPDTDTPSIEWDALQVAP